jgi:hypothetical protein
MNQRIQQLAEQATSGDGWLFDKDKFAELIVRECISTIEGIEPGYKDYRDQIEDAFRRDCVEEIKHKFGVEE